jgi:hypothetical protein
MALAGELVAFFVSLAQELGVVMGVGAITVTLVGHLLSLQAGQEETTKSYVRAARHVRSVALVVIVLSGMVAVLLHYQNGASGIPEAPALLFMWLLVGLLTAFYFLEIDARGWYRDAVEGFEGANWYALFIVHAMVPAISWSLLLEIYAGWLVTFAVIWGVFVGFMRRQTHPSAPAASTPQPRPAPAAAQPAPTPTPVPAPIAPAAAPKPTVPMVAELDLPAPKPATVPPPAANPAPAVQTIMPDLDETIPALRVMPHRPEDIETSNRPATVKFEE